MTYEFYSSIITQLNELPNYRKVVRMERQKCRNNYASVKETRQLEVDPLKESTLVLEEPVPVCEGKHKWEKILALYEKKVQRCISMRIVQRCHDLWYAVEGQQQWYHNRMSMESRSHCPIAIINRYRRSPSRIALYETDIDVRYRCSQTAEFVHLARHNVQVGPTV